MDRENDQQPKLNKLESSDLKSLILYKNRLVVFSLHFNFLICFEKVDLNGNSKENKSNQDVLIATENQNTGMKIQTKFLFLLL